LFSQINSNKVIYYQKVDTLLVDTLPPPNATRGAITTYVIAPVNFFP
jgi:hypothetical protein